MFGYFSFEITLCLAAISRLKSEDSLICRNGYAVKNIMQKYSIQLPFGHFKAARLALFREIFSYNFIFYLVLAKFMHSKLVIQEKIAYHIWQQSQCRRAWSQHIDKILEKSIDKHAWQTACAKIIWVTTVRLGMICALIITVCVPDKQIQQ